MNVFEGEFDESQMPLAFDQPHDPDPKRRELQGSLEVLQQSVQHQNRELTDKEKTISGLSVKVEDLSARNTFLTRHNKALEEENQEQQKQLDDLSQKQRSMSNTTHSSEPSMQKVLGKVKFSDSGPDCRNKTRAAYRKKVEELNVFGANRGLTVNQLILRDQNGRKVPVNIEKPNTYPNLTNEERLEVAEACAWKDQKRVSDKSYSSLTKIGKVPAAAHVKQYETEVNAKLSPILPVIHIMGRDEIY